MIIRPLEATDEASMREADEVMSPFSFSLDLAPDEPFEQWLQRCRADEMGDVPEGRVPALFRVAEVEGQLLGRVSVRLVLNDWLAKYGGHVGYGVLPHHRRKGVATALLGEALSILHAHDVEQALIVCDDDNEASARVAQAFGGVLAERAVDEGGCPIRHYLVPARPVRIDQ